MAFHRSIAGSICEVRHVSGIPGCRQRYPRASVIWFESPLYASCLTSSLFLPDPSSTIRQLPSRNNSSPSSPSSETAWVRATTSRGTILLNSDHAVGLASVILLLQRMPKMTSASCGTVISTVLSATAIAKRKSYLYWFYRRCNRNQRWSWERATSPCFPEYSRNPPCPPAIVNDDV
jgi:hypothetical protein